MKKTAFIFAIAGLLALAFICWAFFYFMRSSLPISRDDSRIPRLIGDQIPPETQSKHATPQLDEIVNDMLRRASLEGISRITWTSDDSRRVQELLGSRMKAESWLPALALLALSPANAGEASLATNDLIRRREDFDGLSPNKVRFILIRKALALELLGVTALQADRDTLRTAIKLDGARELASLWIDQIPEDGQYDYLTELQTYATIQGRAGRGLAYSGVAEDGQLLEKTYREYRTRLGQLDYSKPQTDKAAYVESVFGQLADALALRDYLEENPRAEGLYAILISGQFHDILGKYLNKYHVNYVPLRSQY